jgi:hypothetical protein
VPQGQCGDPEYTGREADWKYQVNKVQAILSIRVVGLKLSLAHIPDNLIHVVEFARKDFGIMHLDVMVMVESLLYDW